MPDLEILDLSCVSPNPDILGCWVDFPKPGSRALEGLLDIEGWVVGRRRPVAAVEVMSGDTAVGRAAVCAIRPDVGTAHPEARWAFASGFRTNVRLLAAGDTVLSLVAVWQGQQRIPFGRIRVEGYWPAERFDREAPLVSVIIPCYNQAHFLEEAIDSVLAQTYPHLEVVVIDDGSNDNTRSIATRVPGVRCVSQSNAGLAAARNAGIRCSNGSFLVFLDADDRLLPVALECGLQCFSLHPEAALVAGQARVIAADGVPLFPKASPPDLPDGDPYLALLRKNRIPVPATAMYRRTVLRAVGGFDGTLDASADHEIYLRVARQFPVRWHAEPVAEYRRHGGSMSRNPELMLSTALAVVRLQRQYTRGSAQARSAYRDGIRFLRDLYGEQVLEKARGFAGRLPGRRLWRSCVTLLRYDRRRLLRLLYLSLRPAPRPRAAARLEADDATELMRRER